MQGLFQNQLLHAVSILFAVVPFAFALIRAFETGGRDLRYVWVAIAALCGAVVTILIARPYGGGPNAAVALSAGVFVIATLLAVCAALLLGTRLGPGIVVVGSAFGFCFAVGCLLHSSRRLKRT